MKRDPVVSVVMNVHVHRIRFVHFNRRPRETVVHRHDALCQAQLRHVRLLQLHATDEKDGEK